jgi:hypothetical protein
MWCFVHSFIHVLCGALFVHSFIHLCALWCLQPGSFQLCMCSSWASVRVDVLLLGTHTHTHTHIGSLCYDTHTHSTYTYTRCFQKEREGEWMNESRAGETISSDRPSVYCRIVPTDHRRKKKRRLEMMRSEETEWELVTRTGTSRLWVMGESEWSEMLVIHSYEALR